MPAWIIDSWSWITQNLWGQNSAWFWTMVQGIAVSLTLIFIAFQLRGQNRQLKSQNDQLQAQMQATGLQILTSLDARWNSKEMIKARRTLCKDFKDAEKTTTTEQVFVLSFFEDIGLFLKRGVLDHEMIWDKWSHYIEGYWLMCKSEVMGCRINDPTWYDKFEFLAKEMRNFADKKLVKAMGAQALDDFVLQEQDLRDL